MYTLDINLADVSSYLGAKKETLDDASLNEILMAKELLIKEMQYKYEYQIFDCSQDEKHKDIHILGTTLTLSGESITTLLKDSSQCIFMAVTLGQQIDTLIRKTEITDLAQSFFLDACASSLVENLCDQVEATLLAKWKERGKFFTDRFSPGYGDLSLSVQPAFCQLLDTEKKMGLKVSKDNMMFPRKSITAIIGIADTPQPMRIKGCKYCNLIQHCQYRKGGKTCG